MDIEPAAVLLLSVFAGAIVTSFSGFAFAPVAGVFLLNFFSNRRSFFPS